MRGRGIESVRIDLIFIVPIFGFWDEISIIGAGSVYIGGGPALDLNWGEMYKNDSTYIHVGVST